MIRTLPRYVSFMLLACQTLILPSKCFVSYCWDGRQSWKRAFLQINTGGEALLCLFCCKHESTFMLKECWRPVCFSLHMCAFMQECVQSFRSVYLHSRMLRCCCSSLTYQQYQCITFLQHTCWSCRQEIQPLRRCNCCCEQSLQC